LSPPKAVETVDLVMRFPQQQGWRALFNPRPGKVALDHVNLTIDRGEIFGLLGPNGAGKTTLVKILSTLTIPTSGRASVTGLEVVSESLNVRRRVGVVYGDERTFFWRLSALDNLLFYASLYHIPRDVAKRRAWELLEMVGLAKDAHTRMHHYSSGMRQRASIARGLLNDPEVLIMDEPTRSLDPIAATNLRRLVKQRVANERRSVLLATNVMSEAEYMCDRLAFISHGQIRLVGEMTALRDVLQVEEAHALVVGRVPNGSIEALCRVDGVDSIEVTLLENDRLRVEIGSRKNLAVIPEIVRRIVEAGGEVWSCTPEELSLDEMFSIVVEASHRER
jgi:ABC-2 type transport system ATP-binding protein